MMTTMQMIAMTCAVCLAAGVLPAAEGKPAADAPTKPSADRAGIVAEEFIYDKAPFPQCHASTIAESGAYLVAAWFGGTREKNPDVGIWVSRKKAGAKGWAKCVEVANGVQSPTKRYPCWNPVLFQPAGGPLMLFYKVGPSPRSWWGMLTTSKDQGRTWSRPTRLPKGIWGPIKNKPLALPDGVILCGTSGEATGWRVFMQSTADLGKTWTSVGPLNDGKEFGAIQPTILRHDKAAKVLQILCRSKQGKITQCWSRNGGKTWGPMTATPLPNPNSGIDAVTLADGRGVLVYNHTGTIAGRWGGRRTPLNVAVSKDGKTWQAAVVLENTPGEYSYPAVIQTSDGLLHTTYTWKRRRVKHVVLDPAKLRLRPMPKGQWPK